jgi:hypothetical protein
MRSLTVFILFTAASLLFTSCETDIDIDLPTPTLNIVVDASIENDQFAQVLVTRGIPYFEKVDLETLLGTIIGDAEVYLSDGIHTELLSLTINPNLFPPVSYLGNDPALKGKLNTSYFLKVIVGEDTITGSTFIPGLVQLDSVWWRPDDETGQFGFGWGAFRDPDTLGNNYRLYSKRQGYPTFVTANRSVSDDRLVNGQDITFSFIRPRPTPRLFTPDSLNETGQTRIYYERGDTISVKFCSIDRPSYEYIRTAESAAGSFGNPFSAPTFIKSNLKGGLGGFVGYAASYHTYVVPQ